MLTDSVFVTESRSAVADRGVGSLQKFNKALATALRGMEGTLLDQMTNNAKEKATSQEDEPGNAKDHKKITRTMYKTKGRLGDVAAGENDFLAKKLDYQLPKAWSSLHHVL